MAISDTELKRRLRLGDHYRYLRGRYGSALPEADDGREDLYELLLAVSLATYSYRKMRKAIEIWAPWMSADEAEELIDRINLTPDYLRYRTARRQGEIWGLTYEKRRAWGIRTVAPCDVSEEEFLRRRRERKNYMQHKRRRNAGRMTRAQWLEANSLSRDKPWEAKGISRSQWYKTRHKAHETGLVPIKLLNVSTLSVSLSKVLGVRKRTSEVGRVGKGSKRRKIAS